MKKLLSIVMSILMLCSCAAGQESRPVEGEQLLESWHIPDVILEYSGIETTATKGSYDWEKDNGDGTKTNTIACGVHPLQFGNIAGVTVCDKADTLTLVFAEGMVSYEISRWEVGSDYNPAEPEESFEVGEEEKIEAENNTIPISNDGKIYIYALNVVYENGTVEYGFKTVPPDTWGLTLSIKNVTPTGGTLVFTQSGGYPTGELETGCDYYIKNADSEELAYLIDDAVWTSEAYRIQKGGTFEIDVDWTWLYGVLPEGTYRICKSVMDFRGPGYYDCKEYSVEFTIPSDGKADGKEMVSIAKLKIVDGAKEGKLVLAGNGTGEVYTLNIGNIPVYLDGEKADASVLEDGMTAEIRYNGEILETYPAAFGKVSAVHVYSLGTKNNPGGNYYDLCGLYLKVLDDLWEDDSGLNSGAKYVSVDLSEAPGNLTEGEKSAIAWVFGSKHGVGSLTMTMEQLKEEGWLVAADGSNDLYRWDNGVLMTIIDDWGEDQSGDPDAFYSLPVIKFNAMKWRSPLGAYLYTGCSTVWPQMGTWSDYNIEAEAIS